MLSNCSPEHWVSIIKIRALAILLVDWNLAHREMKLSLFQGPPRVSWCNAKEAPEKMTTGFCHAGSSDIFFLKKNLRWLASLPMNGVPGVMQLESNASIADTASASSLAFLAATCKFLLFKTACGLHAVSLNWDEGQRWRMLHNNQHSLLAHLRSFFGSFESPAPLLIHFCSGCTSWKSITHWTPGQLQPSSRSSLGLPPCNQAGTSASKGGNEDEMIQEQPGKHIARISVQIECSELDGNQYKCVYVL